VNKLADKYTNSDLKMLEGVRVKLQRVLSTFDKDMERRLDMMDHMEKVAVQK
jgi:hypothetical protein